MTHRCGSLSPAQVASTSRTVATAFFNVFLIPLTSPHNLPSPRQTVPFRSNLVLADKLNQSLKTHLAQLGCCAPPSYLAMSPSRLPVLHSQWPPTNPALRMLIIPPGCVAKLFRLTFSLLLSGRGGGPTFASQPTLIELMDKPK